MPWASSSARCSSYSSRPSRIILLIWATAARASWFDGVCVRRVLSRRLRWGGRRDDGFQLWSGKDRVQGEEDDGAVLVIERHGLGPVIDNGSDLIQPGHS
eukprot:2703568-Rhodomonas_salina.1